MKRLEHSTIIADLARWQELQSLVRDLQYRAPGSVTLGTIYDVDDPENRGRIKVSLEDFDPELKGVGEYAQPSVWLEANPPFEGKQPDSLIGEKVTALLVNSDYNRPVLGEVVGKTQEPTNKMLRLPIYEKGKLPPAKEENLGLVAVERNAKPGCDGLVVCILENNRYVWAGSSHSIQETTPLSTNAKEIAQIGAMQQTFFETSVEAIQSGSAFEPIKDPKKRAVLQAVSNALIAPIISPVSRVLEPLRAVDISVLEGSLVRNAEFIPSLGKTDEKIQALLEATSGDPFKIPSGIKAVTDLIGGVLNDVYAITQDVKQYLSFDEIGSALGELREFTSLIREAPQTVIKQLPNIVGISSREVTRVFEDIYSENVSPVIEDLTNAVERFSGDIQGVLDTVEATPEQLISAAKGVITDELSSFLSRVSELGLDSLFPQSYSVEDLVPIRELVELVEERGVPLPDPRAIRSVEDAVLLKETILSLTDEQISKLEEGWFPDEL